MTPGQIVEYIEGGRLITAVCLEEHQGKVRAFTGSLREVRLSSNRLVHVSRERIPTTLPRQRLAKDLQERSRIRDELAGRIDLTGLWEVLHEEITEYSALDIAELAFGGQVDDDHISAAIRAMLTDRTFFRFRPQGFIPNDPETVKKIRTQRAREREKEIQIQQASRWIRACWENGDAPAPENRDELIELLKEQAVFGKAAPRSKLCEEILKRAGMTNPLAAFKILVRLGVWSRDENLLYHRFKTRRTFPDRVLEEARRLMENTRWDPRSDPSREDLSALWTFTIDSLQTRDIDDALSLEPLGDGYRIGVHITDVDAVIRKGSTLDEEAALRGTSLYLPEERIPMFPPDISEKLCSLMMEELRPAVSLLLDVDAWGEVKRHRFCLSWIRVKQRFSYDEADELLAEPAHPLDIVLRASKAFRQWRLAQGALLLPLPEVSVRVDETGELIVERRDRESPSQILVSEMMILANRIAAQTLREARVPCIYRVQAEPRMKLLEGMVGDLFLNYKQRKLMNRADSQLDPAFHHGLGMDSYTTFTSPVRRYFDLVTQRQISALIKGEPPPYEREELQKMIMETEEALEQAAQLEQSRHRFWILRYLESKIDERTPALVLGRYGKRVALLLRDYMLEASVPAASAPGLQEGQEIQVRIVRSRPFEDEIRVEPC